MELQLNNNQTYLAPTSRSRKKQEDDLLVEFDNNFADLQKLFDENMGNGNLTKRDRKKTEWQHVNKSLLKIENIANARVSIQSNPRSN